MAISPSTPYSVLEFQGGSFDEWGGPGFEQCSQLINHEFERVFYKNMFASGVTIFNIYMVRTSIGFSLAVGFGVLRLLDRFYS